MSHVDVDTPTSVECQNTVLRLPLEEAMLADLVERKRGALWFPAADIPVGAVYVAAWFTNGVVMVAFHAETSQSSAARSFVLAPIHHAFRRERDVDLHPLTIVLVPTSSGNLLFTLYEAINAIRTDDASSN